jgi:hypothetical protein
MKNPLYDAHGNYLGKPEDENQFHPDFRANDEAHEHEEPEPYRLTAEDRERDYQLARARRLERQRMEDNGEFYDSRLDFL